MIMATIHKDARGRSPYWYCAYIGPDGRRKFKSTKKKDRKIAQLICQKWEDAAIGARKNTLTTAQVRRVFNEILEAAGDSPLENFTVKEWLEEWLKGKEAARGEKTAARYRKPIEDFIKSLDKRAALPIRALTAKDIRTFRDAERKSGKSAVTANLAHKVVASALESAHRQGYIEANIARAVDYLPTHKEKVEKTVFQPSEVRKLIAAADGNRDWQGVILLGYYAGLRLGDAMRLTWANVDLAEKVISFTPSKTARLGKRLAIPMHEEIEAFLLEHPAGKSEKDPLFTSLQHLAIGGRSGASMAFRRIMDRAKVDAGTARKAEGKKGRDVSWRTFHALRHTYVTALSTAGVALEVRQKLAGHASESQSLHYTHPEFESLREAVTKLPRLSIVSTE